MAEHKYQIFISPTYSDLREGRRAAIDAGLKKSTSIKTSRERTLVS